MLVHCGGCTGGAMYICTGDHNKKFWCARAQNGYLQSKRGEVILYCSGCCTRGNYTIATNSALVEHTWCQHRPEPDDAPPPPPPPPPGFGAPRAPGFGAPPDHGEHLRILQQANLQLGQEIENLRQANRHLRQANNHLQADIQRLEQADQKIIAQNLKDIQNLTDQLKALSTRVALIEVEHRTGAASSSISSTLSPRAPAGISA